ncbi:unnamed protein product, partial [Rotaria sp. Silwood2]
ILVVGGGETASDLAVELRQQPADIMYTMLMRLFGYYNNIMVRCWRRMVFVPMWGVGGTGVREWAPAVPFLHGFINKSREIVDYIALNRVVSKRGIKNIDGQLI